MSQSVKATVTVMSAVMFAFAGCGGKSFVASGGTAGAATSTGGASAEGGVPSDGGSGGTATVDGTGGYTGSAGGSAGGPPCDPNETPGDGVFVSASSGNDGSGNGTAALPLRTIQQGLAVAAAAGKTVVFLDQGTYAESVALSAASSGVTMRGGFRAIGASWERDCSLAGRAKTVVASPSNIGVRITGVTQRTTLQSMTILTRATGASSAGLGGESCYGVFVSGAGSLVSLLDVDVTAGAGGPGGPVTTTGPGVSVSCDSLAGCADGAPGVAGKNGSTGGDGLFTADGYTTGDGGNAQPGTAGHHGTPGGAATSAACKTKGCSGGGGLCAGLFCGNLGDQTVSSKPGSCGCGGPAGGGGLGGPGGGASVALFASGSGTVVSVASSVFRAKAGGNGAPGVAGQNGTPGTAGARGADAVCWGNCQAVGSGTCNCEQPNSPTLPGGAAGGPGGQGGPGGKGGGGSGGPSIGIVRQGGALALVEADSNVAYDVGGNGADGAAAGTAQSVLTVP